MHFVLNEEIKILANDPLPVFFQECDALSQETDILPVHHLRDRLGPKFENGIKVLAEIEHDAIREMP